jgi:glycosyltransferase involved in cell wall biosynthesis
VIRVLELLTATSPGGGPRQVFDLVRHLPRDAFDVTIAGPMDQRFAADLRGLGLELAAVAVDTLRAFPRTLRAVQRLVHDTRADVVHSHGKGAGLYGRLAAWLVGVPSVHTFHGIHYEGYSRIGQRLYLELERRLAGVTHTIINVSKSQNEEALRLGLTVPEHSEVIVNGIDVDEFAARPASDKAALGLTPGKQAVGYVARFDPVKRHDVLLKAFELVVKRNPNVELLLAGEGPEKARINELAGRLNIRVVMPGTIDRRMNAYTSCDLYVASSSKEGLPLAPLEAMASGLAVVATKVPGNQDVVDDGKTGILVPRDDPAELANAIGSLLEDSVLRARMGQAGRDRVRSEFNIDSMVRMTADVYRRAAASKTTNPGATNPRE